MATIRKRGTKYQVQVRRSGLRPLSRSFHTFKDAQAWARLRELQADRRDFPPDPKALHQTTLGELVGRYRDTVSVTKRTVHTERIVLAAFQLHPICRRKLSELSRADFAEYRDQRLREIKPSSLKRELVPIHHLFELARSEWGFPLTVNPLSKLPISGSSTKRERRLRDGEWQRLIEACKASRNPSLLSIIQFAVFTGLRRGELLAARWDHVDWVGRSLLVPFTKNGLPRTIPLSRGASAVLEALPKCTERIFPSSGNAVRLAWVRLCKRAQVSDLHFHDLRHEAISQFFERGLSVPEVALLSGHQDMRMLLRYSHASRVRVLEKLDGAEAPRPG